MTEGSLIKPLILGAAEDGWLLYKNPAAYNLPFHFSGRDGRGQAVGGLLRIVPELPVFEKFPWEYFDDKRVKWTMDYAAHAVAVVCLFECRHERMTAFFPNSDSFRPGVTTFELPSVRLLKQGTMYRGWNTHERL